MAATEGRTRVLISFGAIKGGFEFTMQLRRDIYRKFGVDPDRNPLFCYLDAESLRTDKSTKFRYDAPSDTTFMKNGRWAEHYGTAMSQCSTMIVLLTKEWLTSHWCLEELALLVSESKKRPGLRCILVTWPDVNEVMKQGTWKTRQFGTTAGSADVNSQINSLSNCFKLSVAGGAPCVGLISRNGTIVGNNTYNYSCSEAETSLILGRIV